MELGQKFELEQGIASMKATKFFATVFITPFGAYKLMKKQTFIMYTFTFFFLQNLPIVSDCMLKFLSLSIVHKLLQIVHLKDYRRFFVKLSWWKKGMTFAKVSNTHKNTNDFIFSLTKNTRRFGGFFLFLVFSVAGDNGRGSFLVFLVFFCFYRFFYFGQMAG